MLDANVETIGSYLTLLSATTRKNGSFEQSLEMLTDWDSLASQKTVGICNRSSCQIPFIIGSGKSSVVLTMFLVIV